MPKSTPEHEIAQEMVLGCVMGRARLISRVITSVYDDALRKHGIRANQLTILSLVSFREQVRPSQLETYLLMDSSTVSRNVKRMCQRGWLATMPAESGRGHVIVLAPRGRDLLEAALPAWRSAQDEARRLLTEDGFDAIRHLADTLSGINSN